MKRLAHFSAVGLLTFMLGVVSVWGYGRLDNLISAAEEALVPAPSTAEITSLMPDPMGRVSNGIRMRFLRTEENEGNLYAVFLVTNEGHEVVGFLSYYETGRGLVLTGTVKQRGQVKTWGPSCGTGVGEVPFLPGESVTYYVKVPDRAAAFEAGFDYVAIYPSSEELERRVAWSETISPPS
jgi:hypothetical protein